MNLQTKYKILIAKLAYSFVKVSRRLVGKGNRDQFTRGGFRWELDLNEGIDFSIYLLGSFEPDLRRFYAPQIKPGDVVLDIGANIGAHTLPLASLVGPEGKVLAIEATDFAAEKLRRNLSLNPALVPQVSVYHALLVSPVASAAPAQITSSWPLDGAVNSTLEGGATKTIGNAQAITLDDLVGEAQLKRVDWIKIDVDGNETTVLEGAERVLREFHPNILIEFSPYCHAEGSFARLLELLNNAHYRFFTVPPLVPLPSDELSLSQYIPSRGSINVLAKAD